MQSAYTTMICIYMEKEEEEEEEGEDRGGIGREREEAGNGERVGTIKKRKRPILPEVKKKPNGEGKRN